MNGALDLLLLKATGDLVQDQSLSDKNVDFPSPIPCVGIIYTKLQKKKIKWREHKKDIQAADFLSIDICKLTKFQFKQSLSEGVSPVTYSFWLQTVQIKMQYLLLSTAPRTNSADLPQHFHASVLTCSSETTNP